MGGLGSAPILSYTLSVNDVGHNLSYAVSVTMNDVLLTCYIIYNKVASMPAVF